MISKAGKLNLLSQDFNWLNVNTLKERKILQKTIYILQEMGINFRYNYNWYLYGPYSPMLADDAFELEVNKPFYDNEIEKYAYKEDTRAVMDNFKALFKDRIENAQWLELISSLLFLKKHYNVRNSALKQLLLTRKAKFLTNPELVDSAMKFIEKNFQQH